jgi:hypothetical protein
MDLRTATGLPVRQPRVLLGVANQEFDLVAQPVVADDLLGRLLGVGRAEDGLNAFVRSQEHYDEQIALQVRAVGYRRQHPDLRLILRRRHLVEARELLA